MEFAEEWADWRKKSGADDVLAGVHSGLAIKIIFVFIKYSYLKPQVAAEKRFVYEYTAFLD